MLTCAILSADSSLWCWGADRTAARLGVPGSRWRSVDADEDRVCAVKNDRSLWCTPQRQDVGPVDLQLRFEAEGPWRVVDTSLHGVCGIKTDGSLWCWGDNRWGQMGAMAPRVSAPTQIPSPTGDPWLSVATDYLSTCALLGNGQEPNTGSIYCWGANMLARFGELRGHLRYSPTLVGEPDARWRKVAIGGNSTCAISLGNRLWCWGAKYAISPYAPVLTLSPYDPVWGPEGGTEPTPVQIGDAEWSDISGHYLQSCGVETTAEGKRIRCWGLDDGLFDGREPFQYAFARYMPAGNIERLSVGVFHGCGLTRDGRLKCWGGNNYHQQNIDDAVYIYEPTEISL